MRSSDRKPAWPSFVWKTCGVQAECSQGPDAADAEHDLLAQAVLDVAAVEAVGDAGGLAGCSRRHVGVEQVQRDPADVDAPDRDRDVLAADLEADLQPVGVHRQPVRVRAGERLLLPAVGVEALVEVALAVEQPDADERHAEVGRRLQVVAGEHAEAARVLGERLGQTELGREVGDEIERAVVAAAGTSGARWCVVERGDDGVDLVQDRAGRPPATRPAARR